jgi:hypothetical protein
MVGISALDDPAMVGMADEFRIAQQGCVLVATDRVWMRS